MRLLVLRGGALGDFLVTLPALRAWRACCPDTHVTLIGNARAGRLGLMDGALDEVHDQAAARWAPIGSGEPWPKALSDWVNTYDRVLGAWPDRDGAIARDFRAWGERYLPVEAADIRARPAARQFLDPLREAGWCTLSEDAELAPVLRLSESARIGAEVKLGTTWAGVAVHPGSGGRAKTWPLAHWQQLVRRLPAPVLWITGPGDAALEPPSDVAVIRAHEWPLDHLAAALGKCAYYAGHDTGVSHLAAAAGASGLLLFGPTDPAIWAPPTPRMRVLRAPGGVLADLSVEAVQAALLAEAGRIGTVPR